MTVYCDAENCEYNENGICCKEKLSISDMFCDSNRLCESVNKEEND